MIRRPLAPSLLAALACALAASGAEAQIRLQRIAANLARPIDIAAPADGTKRLFFALQGGKIVIYDGTAVLSKAFLDISSSVSCCGERGLLSLALHPSYPSNRYFYVLYTAVNGDVTIARFRASSTNPNVAWAGSKLVLLTIPHSQYSNHNGGKLLFGPDGYLYISVGDGGGSGDPNNNAQNLGRLLGKMLRINVDSGSPYSIPASNPFVPVAGARQEIWAYGLRNPWRFSFDRSTGDLYIGDVGQNSWEEIDFQPAASPGGENYGWRLMEGRQCFNPATGCNDGTLKLPISQYSHTWGCSITGGYVYRGAKIPAIAGMYLYVDFCSGVIRGATRASGKWSTMALLATGKKISTFGQDTTGELYVAEHSTSGAVYRIVKQ